MKSQSLIHGKETPYFVFSIIVSVFIYIIAIFSTVGIIIALFLVGFILFSNAMMIGNIRGNGVRISQKQFPEVYERVVQLSKEMQLKTVPDIFVIHSEGAFNAFATRFLGRNMVVIFSEVFELAREKDGKELDFIIAHELAHIKRRHIWKSILVMPAAFVPFLSQAYSRACEYTCDQMAAHYIQDGAAAKRALTILSIGKELYKDVDEHEFLEQIHSESNVAVWFAELLSTHPILPKRIQSVGHFMRMPETPNFRPNNGKIATGASIFGGILLAISIIFALFIAITAAILTFIVDYNENDSVTPLMVAAAEGNLDRVERLIIDGVDIDAIDDESTTALHFAVYNNESDIVKLLLDEGADPNVADNYSTILTTALINESYDIALLLYTRGADPTEEDANGHSAFDVAEVETFADFESYLFANY